jgi:hypothetical protein
MRLIVEVIEFVTLPLIAVGVVGGALVSALAVLV